MVTPVEAVTRTKIQKILKTAESFLLDRTDTQALQPRFDVITVVIKPNGHKLDHIEAAFDKELSEAGDSLDRF
jgi:Holliday junction resolvase-like predicted endonuclease